MNNEERCNIIGFVNDVIRRSHQNGDTGFCAMMRRADNSNQCSCAWEYLVPYCDLSNDHERLAFALTGAAIAREKPEKDGDLSIGKALQIICRGDQEQLEREASRLRRLIGCDTQAELIPVLRPILRYIQSQCSGVVSYRKLLTDLVFWNERTRIRWTKEFYGKIDASPEEAVNTETK